MLRAGRLNRLMVGRVKACGGGRFTVIIQIINTRMGSVFCVLTTVNLFCPPLYIISLSVLMQ